MVFCKTAWVVCFVLLAQSLPMVQARPVLFSRDGGSGGEIAPLMGYALIALGGGGETLQVNPAGLSRPDTPQITAGAYLAEYNTLKTGSHTHTAVTGSPANLSISGPISNSGTFPGYSYGFAFSHPQGQQHLSLLSHEHTGAKADLPPVLSSGLDIDTDFPGGINFSERDEGLGLLNVTSTTLGFGAGLSRGTRAGLSVTWERVAFYENSQISKVYQGGEGGAEGNELAGSTRSHLRLSGETDRLIYLLGVQVEMSPVFTLGLLYRHPSETLAGKGQVLLLRDDALKIYKNGILISERAHQVEIEGEDLDFEIKRPGMVGFGFGFTFDTLIFELDLIRVQALEVYSVFPRVYGQQVSRIGPVENSGLARTRYAMGLALIQDDELTMLFGLRSDQSSTPDDDPVFRKLDMTTLSGGAMWSGQRLTTTLGLAYRFGSNPGAQYIVPEASNAITDKLEFTGLSVLIAGTMGF